MNRIATNEDVSLYGNYIKPGVDYIFDESNKIYTDGSKGIVYYFINDLIPELTDEPTMWFDGDKLGFLKEIKLQHTVQELPWRVPKVRFKNIPGTEVRAMGFTCKGLTHFELNGEDERFVGVRHWPATRKFLTGGFGFHMICPLTGGHGYNIEVQDGGTIIMECFESQHGFSGLRLMENNDGRVVSRLVIENFYIHDTCEGEPLYVGSTKAPPIPRFENVTINNGIIARAAAEAIQLQNIAGSCIRNLTIYAGQTNWLNAFQNYQSTCFQFLANGGENIIRNILVDGYGNSGFMPFSCQPTDYRAKEINEVLVEDVLFFNGRGTGTYFNKSCSNGITWRFKNLMYCEFNDSWYQNTDNPDASVLFRTGGGDDRIVIEKLIHDGSKTSLVDNPQNYKIGEIIQAKIERPIYRNSGFHESSDRIMQWSSVYASYFPGPDNTPVQWKKDDIIIDIDTVKGHYQFYKCLADHQSNTIRPGDHALFRHLTWDEYGIRSDYFGWNKNSTQSMLPPDDLRLIPGHSLSHLGIITTEPELHKKRGIVEDYFLWGKRYSLTDNGELYINNELQ